MLLPRRRAGRTRSLVAFAWLLVLACSSGTTTQLTPAHAAAMRDSVQSMLDDFRRYAANRQYDSLIGLYVSDTTLRWIEDGQLRLRSSDALKGYYGALPGSTSIEMRYDSLEITPLKPGAASVLTWYRTTVKDSTRGDFTFGGLLTMTVVHENDGWRIANGHTSSPPARPDSSAR